jgi:nucleotide-binding universal stress UspA family protein
MGFHIVVGTDGSASATAGVEWAADEAALRRLPLRIVHVLESRTGESLDRPPDRLPAGMAGEGILDEAATVARDRHNSVPVTSALLTGRIAEEILAEAPAARTIVLASRGIGGFASLVLGSVCLRVAGHTAGPVVVVRQSPREARGEIVVGFDGSEPARAALGYAFEEASLRQARLRVLCAWQLPLGPGLGAGYSPAIDQIAHGDEAMVRDELATWWEKHPDVEATGSVVLGQPVSELCAASAQADLLIVGARGRGALSSAVLGSVSHGVLHHARCAVAVVGRDWHDDT